MPTLGDSWQFQGSARLGLCSSQTESPGLILRVQKYYVAGGVRSIWAATHFHACNTRRQGICWGLGEQLQQRGCESSAHQKPSSGVAPQHQKSHLQRWDVDDGPQGVVVGDVAHSGCLIHPRVGCSTDVIQTGAHLGVQQCLVLHSFHKLFLLVCRLTFLTCLPNWSGFDMRHVFGLRMLFDGLRACGDVTSGQIQRCLACSGNIQGVEMSSVSAVP